MGSFASDDVQRVVRFWCDLVLKKQIILPLNFIIQIVFCHNSNIFSGCSLCLFKAWVIGLVLCYYEEIDSIHSTNFSKYAIAC